jgi:hypothetical protein
MKRIAMTQSSGINSFSIIINGTGAVNDFILSISVDVADGQIMSSLTTVLVIVGRFVVAIENPTLSETTISIVLNVTWLVWLIWTAFTQAW